ncbi:LPS translocon maturation chaperone LptM [Erwinia phyllosphaerae]|uniref:LPS translocon maturation chaperone LptM n=1 Tax=Erwinia phyllosphaerae TaxID=2853256 RepID=UPI001FEF6310|nr:lipoprotein [Erwinia phyllosphaerae]MBV4369070.1 lipoprotein [Erwinia phyllosphaerae]
MKKMICRLALALAVVSLAGCGLKGPLYFPKQEQPQKTAGKATQPKTASTAAVNAQQQSKTTDAEQQSAQ